MILKSIYTHHIWLKLKKNRYRWQLIILCRLQPTLTYLLKKIWLMWEWFICADLNMYCRLDFSKNTFITLTAHHWCLIYHAAGWKIKISKRLSCLLSRINALILGTSLPIVPCLDLKTLASTICLYSITCSLSRVIQTRRFSEAIHFVKMYGLYYRSVLSCLYFTTLYPDRF